MPRMDPTADAINAVGLWICEHRPELSPLFDAAVTDRSDPRAASLLRAFVYLGFEAGKAPAERERDEADAERANEQHRAERLARELGDALDEGREQLKAIERYTQAFNYLVHNTSRVRDRIGLFADRIIAGDGVHEAARKAMESMG